MFYFSIYGQFKCLYKKLIGKIKSIKILTPPGLDPLTFGLFARRPTTRPSVTQ